MSFEVPAPAPAAPEASPAATVIFRDRWSSEQRRDEIAASLGGGDLLRQLVETDVVPNVKVSSEMLIVPAGAQSALPAVKAVMEGLVETWRAGYEGPDERNPLRGVQVRTVHGTAGDGESWEGWVVLTSAAADREQTDLDGTFNGMALRTAKIINALQGLDVRA